MRTVALKRSGQELQRILKIVKKADAVLRSPEGDEMLMSWIDDFDYEIAAQRRNKKLMAFLTESFRQARSQKGISLEEARHRLGLPSRSGKNERAAKDGTGNAMKVIRVSRRSPVIIGLLEQACRDNLILKTADGSEWFLTAVSEGDYQAATRRRSEAVMDYLDKLGRQGKLPPLEVVFVQDWPRHIRGRGKRRPPSKRA